MKKQIKQKIAYALALVLGVVSIFGGTMFSLPSMRTVHAEETYVTVSTADELYKALSNGGYIKLMDSIYGVYGVSAKLTQDVTLDLDKYTIGGASNNPAFMIFNGASLTLTGSGKVNGNISVGGYPDGNTLSTGTLILKDSVEIYSTKSGGTSAVAVGKDSTFNMSGGKISSSNETAVNVWGGNFTMTGGTITGHDDTSYGIGGGVVVDSIWGGTFTMNGGTINGCSAKYGGGVYVGKGSFTANGGNITNNKASISGGGVYVKTGATYTPSASVVFSGNTAGDSSTNDVGRGSGPSSADSSSSSSSSGSGGAVVRRSSSSDDDDDDDDDDSSSSSFSSGAVRTSGSGSGKADYKKAGTNSVKYVESAVSANSKSAKVPATVKIGGKTYAVTSIGANAFKGYSKLTSMKIGRNVKRIGAGAFNGCTNLKALTINSKNIQAKNIKGAFKGSAVKTIYVPASKVQAYKNVFTKAVTGSKGKISVKAKQPSKSSKKK